ncbi:response regulator transcription factor [Sulfurimonas sp. SAG-AH-194-C21]|nr:response regulator transcription factor [Sulfurimonas sp. SAG-AH-194-C21]MDF1882357.1 response regulator transcription factor [Sulfurimonas sp. SAG-AH-194-C21]
MRILYLEDDSQLANMVVEYLQKYLIVDYASSYDEAKEFIDTFHYDVCLIDRNIRGHDIGMNLIELIHNKSEETGVIVLSSFGTTSDKIDGLEFGANDYMEKPFHIKELYARILALHRRNTPKLINLENVQFDTFNRRIFEDEKEIFLTNKENDLLFYLLIHNNSVISQEQLIQALYLHPEEIASNTISVRINTIRKKLPINIIKNIKTRGYIIEIK